MRALMTLVFLSNIAYTFAESAPLQVSDFARQPRLFSVDLSSNGTYFSSIVYVGEQRAIVVEKLYAKEKPYIVTTKDWDFRWYAWLSDRVMIAGVGIPTTVRGTPVVVTRLARIDAEKRQTKLLFAGEDDQSFWQIQDDVISTLPGQPEHFLIQSGGSKPNAYRASINSRRLPTITAQRSLGGVHDWQADADGNVRVGTGFTANQKEPILKLLDGEGEWHDFTHLLARDFEVMALPTHEPDVVYAQVSTEDAPFRQLQKFHVSTGTFGEVLASNPLSDIAHVTLNTAGNAIESISYESSLVATEYFDTWLQSLLTAFNKAVPDTRNHIAAISQDRSRALILSWSGHLPAHYYLFETDSKHATYLQSAYPSLMDRAPGRVHERTFEARDGLVIPAFLTLPAGISPDRASNLPTVIFPHGGPHARDFNEFDWMSQMFAHQGYAVLQINFRGSTGYAFEKLGRREWGGTMQDDITDGTRWLIDEGISDPKRICIVGGSYGGYAALMGLATEPDLYRCGASFNGVTDLVHLLSQQTMYIGGRFYSRFIGNLSSGRKDLKAASPVNLADQIKAPVLLLHGDKDRVVHYSHAKRMSRALKDHPHELVVLEDEGHHLQRPARRLEFAEKLMAFLNDHLGSS